jgi:hypothetical protein
LKSEERKINRYLQAFHAYGLLFFLWLLYAEGVRFFPSHFMAAIHFTSAAYFSYRYIVACRTPVVKTTPNSSSKDEFQTIVKNLFSDDTNPQNQ